VPVGPLVLAALVAAAGAAAFGFLLGRGGAANGADPDAAGGAGSPWARAGAPVALAAAYVAGHYALRGFDWPPPQTSEWLPIVALAAAGAGVVEGLWPDRAGARWAARAVAAGAVLGLVLRLKLKNFWGLGEAVAWLAGLEAALLVGLLGLDLLRRVVPVPERAAGSAPGDGGPAAAAAVGALVGGAAGGCAAAGSLVLGQLGGALGAAWGGLAVVSLWRPALVRPALPTAGLLLAGVVLNAVFFAYDLPTSAALALGALGAVPFLASLAGLPPLRRHWVLSALVALTLAGGAAGGLAAAAFRATAAEDAGEEVDPDDPYGPGAYEAYGGG